MARSAPAAYGLTIDTRTGDADDLFSTVEGVEGVAQDALDRLFNETCLGPGGEDYGIDIEKWPGTPVDQLRRRSALVSEVLQRDDRVLTADVRIRAVAVGDPRAALYSATMTIDATTAAGPFRRVFAFSETAVADITAAWSNDT